MPRAVRRTILWGTMTIAAGKRRRCLFRVDPEGLVAVRVGNPLSVTTFFLVLYLFFFLLWDAYGSRAVRENLQKYQPMLCLHGHIHESRGKDAVGRTVCLNPGSEYNQGVLHGVLVDLENRKLASYQFTMG